MTMTADTPDTKELKDGRVVAIAGPVVDVEFPPDALPEINHALEMDIELEGAKITVTAEVLGLTKGPKIVIQKYKNKTGYKKRQGHRQKYTQVKVTDISL